MSQIPITVVILTNRNDQRFQNALESAQFAKTILVVDNNSDNNWVNLKNKYHFTIIEHFKKIKDYSKIRNMALEKVETDWVLFLDSDETLPQSAQSEIQEIITQNLYDAISIKRSDYFLGKKLRFGETATTYIVRMFKKDSSKFVRNVHEVVKTKGKLGSANFEISHFSHNSISDFLMKISEYSLLESNNKKSNKTENTIQLITFPIAKFILNYIFKLGFLDGFRGLIYAILMSFHSFFVRIFYYENL